MPNLNSEHHYIFFPISDSWITKAKEIRGSEDSIPGQQRFDSDNRWAGKIGEWSFYKTYPYMKAVTSNYRSEDHDFLSPKTSLKYEVKLNLSNRPFEDYFTAMIDASQVSKNSADIVVFQYWFESSREVRLCGWLYLYQIKRRGKLYKKGDSRPYSKTTFHNNCWLIPYKDMNAMFVMPDQLERSS